jgi:hypothetical protein
VDGRFALEDSLRVLIGVLLERSISLRNLCVLGFSRGYLSSRKSGHLSEGSLGFE